jgi:hypothetical protein
MESVADTRDQHRSDLEALALPAKVEAMFAEEEARVLGALATDDAGMLAVLPGKHLLSLLTDELGLEGQADLTALVVGALGRRRADRNAGLTELGTLLEATLVTYLPPRRVH